MRKRFEQQLSLGQIPITDLKIPIKNKNSLDELLVALQAIYGNDEYNHKIFNVLECYLCLDKKKTGRTGMNLWCIFVLSQVRLCLNTSYNMLHNLANNHKNLRIIMGIETEFGVERIIIEYQNIYDNVSKLSNEMLREINAIVLEFGHKEVFKKKETTALHLKTDSFVVESNVHFPTDYNLLWDCARKCIDNVCKFLKKYPNIEGWRKIENWRFELKSLMRELGKTSASAGKLKQERMVLSANNYLKKAKGLLQKLQKELPNFPLLDTTDMIYIIALEHFKFLLEKHINLVERRIIQGEKIPHQEKIFSIFETYTEWIKKGKMHPSVELGKMLSITTDQYNLIVDYELMNETDDRDIVIMLADRLLAKYKINSWSFDKGHWNKDNKQLLQLEIPQVIMPKLGKRNKEEEAEEKSSSFKRLKNKHSAIESNINELENRGLNRCPDRGIFHFSSYIGMAVCAYNLRKIGRQILDFQRNVLEATPKVFHVAA